MPGGKYFQTRRDRKNTVVNSKTAVTSLPYTDNFPEQTACNGYKLYENSGMTLKCGLILTHVQSLLIRLALLLRMLYGYLGARQHLHIESISWQSFVQVPLIEISKAPDRKPLLITSNKSPVQKYYAPA